MEESDAISISVISDGNEDGEDNDGVDEVGEDKYQNPNVNQVASLLKVF
jgi:hypothetical protein